MSTARAHPWLSRAGLVATLFFASCTNGQVDPSAPDAADTTGTSAEASTATVAAKRGPVRCATGGCHVGTSTSAAHAALFGATASEAAQTAHAELGCVACHGGDGSAKTEQAAHPVSGPRELLAREHTSASCAACHVPGEVPGMEPVVAGAQVFLELGCAFCHPGLAAPIGRATFAPTLQGINTRGAKLLAKVLRDPASVEPKSVMPAYGHVLDASPEKDRALMAYLLSLRLTKPVRKVDHDPKVACVSCHATATPKTTPHANHRCAWIAAKKTEVTCARCHAGGVPASTDECLYIAERRRECGVCHEGGSLGSRLP
ncbi:hypothetical protein L6R52_36115 [Myxococcota bacterium]|nr:hypothetical protein [Myxococcota bacterium]